MGILSEQGKMPFCFYRLIAETEHLVKDELEVDLASLQHSAVRLDGNGYAA